MHLHDKMVPIYKEVCSTMKEHFPAIPSKDGDHLAEAERRLLAEEHEGPVQGPWVRHT